MIKKKIVSRHDLETVIEALDILKLSFTIESSSTDHYYNIVIFL